MHANVMQVSYWVATEIVLTPNLKERVRMLAKFVTIADYCKTFNNWNTLMEIMIGLNLGCVQRLKKTWAVSNSHLLWVCANPIRVLERKNRIPFRSLALPQIR